MPQQLHIRDFLADRSGRTVLDVRSPGEYHHGHIPGAVSFPLFTDEERAQVGTCYKQKGKEKAVHLGLEMVGPKLAGFVSDAQRLAPNRRVAEHCSRGGKRSGSMAWLLETAGFDVTVLVGGYKAYRQMVLQDFDATNLDIQVLGGSTGSGKTRILHALRDLGEQIIDLEAIACHKGSAFGFIGEQPQPTVEQFENLLHDVVGALDAGRRVWVENESRSIGRVFIPDGFWRAMKASPLYNIEIPQEARINNLLADYVLSDREDLKTAFMKIDRKLGGLKLKQALEALDAGDFALAAAIALEYYDKTYQHCLDENKAPVIHRLPFEHGDPGEIARGLVGLVIGDW